MNSLLLNHVSKAVALYVNASRSNSAEEMNEIEIKLMDAKIAESLAGTADEFHNASVELVREQLYDFAVRLLDLGIRKYPISTDLYADILKYGLECRRIQTLQIYYEGGNNYQGLKNIPKRFWTWRSFTFSIDYLQEYLKYFDEGTDQFDNIKKEIELLIASYYKCAESFTDQSEHEKAYMAESEYLALIGETDKSYEILKNAINSLPGHCPQCALRLADYYFEKADYENAVKYSRVAIDSVSTQDAISVGYAYFIMAISMERKAKFVDKVTLNENICRPIFKAYKCAYVDLCIDKRRTLCQSVQKRVMQLEIETGLESDIDFQQNNLDLNALASLINSSEN